MHGRTILGVQRVDTLELLGDWMEWLDGDGPH